MTTIGAIFDFLTSPECKDTYGRMDILLHANIITKEQHQAVEGTSKRPTNGICSYDIALSQARDNARNAAIDENGRQAGAKKHIEGRGDCVATFITIWKKAHWGYVTEARLKKGQAGRRSKISAANAKAAKLADRLDRNEAAAKYEEAQAAATCRAPLSTDKSGTVPTGKVCDASLAPRNGKDGRFLELLDKDGKGRNGPKSRSGHPVWNICGAHAKQRRDGYQGFTAKGVDDGRHGNTVGLTHSTYAAWVADGRPAVHENFPEPAGRFDEGSHGTHPLAETDIYVTTAEATDGRPVFKVGIGRDYKTGNVIACLPRWQAYAIEQTMHEYINNEVDACRIGNDAGLPTDRWGTTETYYLPETAKDYPEGFLAELRHAIIELSESFEIDDYCEDYYNNKKTVVGLKDNVAQIREYIEDFPGNEKGALVWGLGGTDAEDWDAIDTDDFDSVYDDLIGY